MSRVLSFLCCGGKPHAPVTPVRQTNLAPLRRSSTVGMTTGTAVPTEMRSKGMNKPLREYRFPRVADVEGANVSA
jgi:hypothetical protein